MTSSDAETPKQAARRLFQKSIAKGFEPTGLHEYQDAEGRPIYWRARLKQGASGKKLIRPFHHDGEQFVVGEPTISRGQKPLYRLPKLIKANPSMPVLITEGEQKVEALEKLNLIATTSGSATSADGADWTPLTGRECIIWPDHDDAGQKYADALVTILARLGCKIWIIQADEIGVLESGDVVDWLAANKDATAIDVMALPRYEAERIASRPVLSGPSVQLIKASSVPITPISWLWTEWLARGKIHILAGDAGTGKTTLALRLAATLTKGGTWPDGTRAPTGSVLIWSGEDSIQDTLTPRLIAAGADLDRVSFISGVENGGHSRAFDPATDMKLLEDTARQMPDLCMLILDPVVSATQGDSHRNTEVRRSLQPLVDLAESLRVCVIGITHFSKGTSNRSPIERITGSLAFGAVARVVLVVGKDANAEGGGDARVFLRAKSNIGPDDGGFRYRLEQREIEANGGLIRTSEAIFAEAVTGSARAILGELEAPANEQVPGETKSAIDWLLEMLSNGPRPASEVKEAAKDAGYSERTIQRAMRKAGIKSDRTGFGQPAVWRLPDGSRANLGPVAPVPPLPELGATGATVANGVNDRGPLGAYDGQMNQPEL